MEKGSEDRNERRREDEKGKGGWKGKVKIRIEM